MNTQSPEQHNFFSTLPTRALQSIAFLLPLPDFINLRYADPRNTLPALTCMQPRFEETYCQEEKEISYLDDRIHGTWSFVTDCSFIRVLNRSTQILSRKYHSVKGPSRLIKTSHQIAYLTDECCTGRSTYIQGDLISKEWDETQIITYDMLPENFKELKKHYTPLSCPI